MALMLLSTSMGSFLENRRLLFLKWQVSWTMTGVTWSESKLLEDASFTINRSAFMEPHRMSMITQVTFVHVARGLTFLVKGAC
jgi:hypothetical protein